MLLLSSLLPLLLSLLLLLLPFLLLFLPILLLLLLLLPLFLLLLLLFLLLLLLLVRRCRHPRRRRRPPAHLLLFLLLLLLNMSSLLVLHPYLQVECERPFGHRSHHLALGRFCVSALRVLPPPTFTVCFHLLQHAFPGVQRTIRKVPKLPSLLVPSPEVVSTHGLSYRHANHDHIGLHLNAKWGRF